jgi:hypothetical protein
MDSNMGSYTEPNMVLPSRKMNLYKDTQFMPLVSTGEWYKTQYGCLRGVDPTEITRRYTFPDAPIPDGIPHEPAAPAKICLQYDTAWPMEEVDPEGMVEAARNHPQFAFRSGGPTTAHQIDVESQLRRLDQPLTKCQAVIADDAPLYYNTVQPPVPSGVRADVLNAANPMSSILRPGADECRVAADKVAFAASGRRFHNPTRQDTQRFVVPFQPPGTGTVEPRGSASPGPGRAYYS